MWFDPQTLLARSYPPATAATFEVQAGTKVAESQKSQPAANHAALDPDSYCWPHSSAWNTSEIALFNRRAALFVRRGASDTEAERLAETLVQCDREGDSMHACMECRHLQTSGPWRCCNWQSAGVAVRAVDAGLARTMLAERLECDPLVIEAQLAHSVRDANGRAYNRTTYLKQRQTMMQRWADYLDKLAAGADVVQLKRA